MNYLNPLKFRFFTYAEGSSWGDRYKVMASNKDIGYLFRDCGKVSRAQSSPSYALNHAIINQAGGYGKEITFDEALLLLDDYELLQKNLDI